MHLRRPVISAHTRAVVRALLTLQLVSEKTSSAFAVNVLIETSCIEVTSGELVEDPRDSASGLGQVLWNCKQCGTTMWSHYASAKERVSFIRAGTLNEPSLAPPDIHIFTSTKSSWVLLPRQHTH